MNEWMKMRSGMKRLDWLVGWLPSELMNDPSNTHHTLCGPVERAYSLQPTDHRVGWISSARSADEFDFFIFLDRFTACWSLANQDEERKRGSGDFSLSLSLSIFISLHDVLQFLSSRL